MNDNYDSKFERRIHPLMESLGFIRCDDFYQHPFSDKTGQAFRAKADWYHPVLELYAETKSHTLNSKTTLETAGNAEQHQRRHRETKGQAFKRIDQLNTQWAHSKYKQTIVQRSLSPQSMIVVFDKPIPLEEMQAYVKVGLVCVSLSSLKSYLAYIHFVRRGLPLRYNLFYEDEGISFVL